MKWMLVVVGIMNGSPQVSNEGVYETMSHCFFARETIIWEMFQKPDGYPPPNWQVVCVPTDKY